MSNLRHFVYRRCLLALIGVCALLFSLAMLHPYPRQSLFGPTIRGKPWCYWEEAVRRRRHREEYENKFTARTLRWFGIEFEPIGGRELFDHPEMFPLLLALTDDPDPEVRQCVLQALISYDRFHDPAAVPMLRRRLGDDDSCCRIIAATAIWLIDSSEPVLEVLLREIEDPQCDCRSLAISHLAGWSKRDPSLFPHLARLGAHEDAQVRTRTMLAVQLCGDKATSLLLKGADDPEVSVRRMAINSLSLLNSPPKEAIPVLERRFSDDDKEVRDRAVDAIRAIDPDRYDRLKAGRKID